MTRGKEGFSIVDHFTSQPFLFELVPKASLWSRVMKQDAISSSLIYAQFSM